jgi:integrase
MRNILNRAVKWGMASRSVADSIDTDDLPKATKPQSVVLNESELRRLLDEAKKPSSRSTRRGYLSAYAAFYPAVVFAAYTGARRGEVLALRWSELDLDASTATISRSLAQTRDGLFFKEPKSGRSRTISISSTLVAILRSHRAAQHAENSLSARPTRTSGLVFARPDGTTFTPWNFGGVPRSRAPRRRDPDSSPRPPGHTRLAARESWRADRGRLQAARSLDHRGHGGPLLGRLRRP